MLWLDQAVERMGDHARQTVEAGIGAGHLAASAISFWEIALLVSKRRLRMHRPPALWRRDWLEQGLVELPVCGAIGIAGAFLPGFHADPADRMIVATAQDFGATLLTADERILAWPGPLDRQDARI